MAVYENKRATPTIRPKGLEIVRTAYLNKLLPILNGWWRSDSVKSTT